MDATGQHMLETLERIFAELDEMGVQADTVTCPHVDGRRGIGTLVYMGRTLDFCRDCHDRVCAELGRQVDNLASRVNIPDDYRWPRPSEFPASWRPSLFTAASGCSTDA